MAEYKIAYPITHENERGFTVDHAGATNDGISLRFLRQQGLELGDIDGDGDIDADDIRALTPEQKKELMRLRFWIPLRLDAVWRQAVATKIFDLAVNMGPRQAVKLLQAALNRLGNRLLIDGDLGAKTLAAVNHQGPGLLLEQFRREAVAFYLDLVRRKPEFSRFGEGWHDRALQ